MSDFLTGVMVDPGEGKSRFSPGDEVTTDPSAWNFCDKQMFDVMFEAGKISIEPEKPKARKTKRKKAEEVEHASS